MTQVPRDAEQVSARALQFPTALQTARHLQEGLLHKVLNPLADPMTPRETIEYLGEQTGTLLDSAVYDALREVVLRGKRLVFIDAVLP